MKLKDLCADEMPREKLVSKGPEALSNVELLAILLRTGRGGANAMDVAREMLVGSGGRLSDLANMPVRDMCRTCGVGPGKAVAVAAAFELGRRMEQEAVSVTRFSISSPRIVFRLMLPLMRGLDHEQCWILHLNRSNRLIHKEMVSSGGMDSTVIDNRVIVRKALERKAAGLILVHNHPSGSALPSVADITHTQELDRALKTCSISLIDHIIIASGGYYSFSDEDLVDA